MKGPTLVVLAAGRAVRYGGLKPLAPVGPGGEAVIDLLGSDATAAGWRSIVFVVSPTTGRVIEYHISHTWPSTVDVHYAVQDVPRGTVDAVLTGAALVPEHSSFGVANADDVYGEQGLTLLADHVAGDDPASALVGYRLIQTLVGDSPVTRGVCSVNSDGYLASVDERRKVAQAASGRIETGDGHEPAELEPDAVVSVNLWGIRPDLRALLEVALRDAEGTEGEVLLPEVVGAALLRAQALDAGTGPATGGAESTGATGSASRALRIRVPVAEGRCIGVTHPSDLALVQAELAQSVGRGERPAQLWSHQVSARAGGIGGIGGS